MNLKAFGQTLNVKINIQSAAIFFKLCIISRRVYPWILEQVTETIAMIESKTSNQNHYMGISLLDCMDRISIVLQENCQVQPRLIWVSVAR